MNKRIEEMSLRHWPALSTIHYDGWILRFAGGYSKRANSVVALYESTIDLQSKIRYCEELYQAHGLRPSFKITAFSEPQVLDAALEKDAYDQIDETIVQTMSMATLEVMPSLVGVNTKEQLSSDWIEDFCRLSGVDLKHQNTIYGMLTRLQHRTCFLRLYLDGEVVACGFGVQEQDYIGLYDIVVDRSQRGKGIGEQLLLNLLRWGKEQGAGNAYLAVVANNKPARRLYEKLGFQEVYRYWYRVKGS